MKLLFIIIVNCEISQQQEEFCCDNYSKKKKASNRAKQIVYFFLRQILQHAYDVASSNQNSEKRAVLINRNKI